MVVSLSRFGLPEDDFGGDGSMGSVHIVSGVSELSGVKNYTSLTIDAGTAIVTSVGAKLHIKITGDLIVNGLLIADGRGRAGGNGSTAQNYKVRNIGTNFPDASAASAGATGTQSEVCAAGGGGGSGGEGGMWNGLATTSTSGAGGAGGARSSLFGGAAGGVGGTAPVERYINPGPAIGNDGNAGSGPAANALSADVGGVLISGSWYQTIGSSFNIQQYFADLSNPDNVLPSLEAGAGGGGGGGGGGGCWVSSPDSQGDPGGAGGAASSQPAGDTTGGHGGAGSMGYYWSRAAAGAGGGAGGAGGGVIWIEVAGNVTIGGSGRISANGGNGGNGASVPYTGGGGGSLGAGGCGGGGGGGGGGVVAIFYRGTLTNVSVGSNVQANAGSGGSGGFAGGSDLGCHGGNGNAGAAGNPGWVIVARDDRTKPLMRS